MITQVHVGRFTILDGSMLFVHADRDKLYLMVGEYMRSRPVIFPAARNIACTTVPSDAYLLQVRATTARDAVALPFHERSEERRVGKAVVRTCSFRRRPNNYKK